MTRTTLPILALCLLSACEIRAQKPIVSDYNGASVKIQMTNFMGEGVRNDASDAEATRICATGGHKRAEYASTVTLPGYNVEHLYLCL